jgi:hypothetical protein
VIGKGDLDIPPTTPHLTLHLISPSISPTKKDLDISST